jgi:hypothetical protein
VAITPFVLRSFSTRRRPSAAQFGRDDDPGARSLEYLIEGANRAGIEHGKRFVEVRIPFHSLTPGIVDTLQHRAVDVEEEDSHLGILDLTDRQTSPAAVLTYS